MSRHVGQSLVLGSITGLCARGVNVLGCVLGL